MLKLCRFILAIPLVMLGFLGLRVMPEDLRSDFLDKLFEKMTEVP